MWQDPDTVQKLGKTQQTQHRANLVRKNDRNGHKRTTTQGDTQKAGPMGILRKLIYSCNHESRVPRWDDMLADVDRQYVREYGIAERQSRGFRVLKDWNL
jgi:hypothetical protein